MLSALKSIFKAGLFDGAGGKVSCDSRDEILRSLGDGIEKLGELRRYRQVSPRVVELLQVRV